MPAMTPPEHLAAYHLCNARDELKQATKRLHHAQLTLKAEAAQKLYEATADLIERLNKLQSTDPQPPKAA